jgi:hypothetical protein
MRIAAIDANGNSGLGNLLAECYRLDAQRIFLFRSVAHEIAQCLRANQTQADERFLDAAEQFLTAPAPSTPPCAERAFPSPNPFCAVSTMPIGASLETSARAVELCGSHIVIAVPTQSFLVDDDNALENASIWIVGGERAPREHQERGRYILAPGALDEEGGVLVVDIVDNQAHARFKDRSWTTLRRATMDLSKHNRFSVHG